MVHKTFGWAFILLSFLVYFGILPETGPFDSVTTSIVFLIVGLAVFEFGEKLEGGD